MVSIFLDEQSLETFVIQNPYSDHGIFHHTSCCMSHAAFSYLQRNKRIRDSKKIENYNTFLKVTTGTDYGP